MSGIGRFHPLGLCQNGRPTLIKNPLCSKSLESITQVFASGTSSEASPTNVLMDEAVKHAGFTHIALEITDAEVVKQQLDGHNIPITETVEFGGAVFFFIRDPDGNVIEFHKPAA